MRPLGLESSRSCSSAVGRACDGSAMLCSLGCAFMTGLFISHPLQVRSQEC